MPYICHTCIEFWSVIAPTDGDRMIVAPHWHHCEPGRPRLGAADSRGFSTLWRSAKISGLCFDIFIVIGKEHDFLSINCWFFSENFQNLFTLEALEAGIYSGADVQRFQRLKLLMSPFSTRVNVHPPQGWSQVLIQYWPIPKPSEGTAACWSPKLSYYE